VTGPGRPPETPESGTGWYVYGVVPTAETGKELFAGVHGVGGASIALVDGGSVSAVASEVPLAEFGEGPLADNIRDPEWLEDRVRSHEAVLEAVLNRAPVVPFRFGTIYRGDEQVRAMLSEEERLAEALDRVRGKVELGVKGFLATAAAEPDAGGAGDEVSAGRRYLEEKQRERRLAEEREALRARCAQESHERLSAAADAAAANPLHPREVSRRDEEMFLNGAYLVAKEREHDFRGALTALEAEFAEVGATYELTGPWPPYNFVEDEA
jgi:hypothetical protein